MGRQPFEPALVSPGDAGGQHGGGRRRTKGGGQRLTERSIFGIGFRKGKDQPRIGTELSRPHGNRPRQPLPDLRAARLHGFRQNDDRIDGREFAIDRNGFRPGRCSLLDRKTACAGTGEADRLDMRVVYQRCAHFDTAMQQRESARRKSACLKRRLDRTANPLRCPRMGGVRLGNDGAASREG